MNASDRVVARRYAGALFLSAGKAGDKLRQELAEAFKQLSPKLELLKNPTIAPAAKKDLVAKTVTGASAPVNTFLKFLIDKKRMALLPVIVSDVAKLIDESTGKVRAQVRTATDMTPAELETLAKRLSKYTGKEVVVEAKTDPELLGGVVVRMGDTVLDGSIQGQLKALAARLIEA